MNGEPPGLPGPRSRRGRGGAMWTWGALSVQGRWTPAAWGVDDARSSRGAVGPSPWRAPAERSTASGGPRASTHGPCGRRCLFPRVGGGGEVGQRGNLGRDLGPAAGRRAPCRPGGLAGCCGPRRGPLRLGRTTRSPWTLDRGVRWRGAWWWPPEPSGRVLPPAGGWSHRPLSLKARVDGVRCGGFVSKLLFASGLAHRSDGRPGGAGTGSDFRADGRFAAEGATAAGEAGPAARGFASPRARSL
jgi:hypothetical protein